MELQKLFEIQAGLDYHITKEHPVQEGEDQKRFEIIDWLIKQAEKTDRYYNVLHKIAYGPETGSEINGIDYRLDHKKWQRLATDVLEGEE